MKRRGFLGMLGAGAVAGPAMAKQAVANVGVSPILGNAAVIGNGLGYDDGPCEVPGTWGAAIDKANYFSDRAGLLRRLLSGEENEPEDWDEVRRRKRVLVEHNINNLASVSHVHKLNMVINANNRIERDFRRRHWMNELLDIERMK
jgi:hypothetical protein